LADKPDKAEEEEVLEEQEKEESLVMDFSTAFKNEGRRGVGMKKKKKKVGSATAIETVGDDPLDDVNKDLEDENFIPNEALDQVIEIPRNLTITQAEMSERKCMD